MPHGKRITHATGLEKGPWITAPELSRVPGLSHGFGTRALGDQRVPATDRDWLPGMGAREVRRLRQVHGTQVVAPEDGGSYGAPPAADAWAGTPPAGVLLGILTADCLPVIFCHPPTGHLAIAHAGWRGAVDGIVAATVDALRVPGAELRVALGPCIGPCCYQVGEEVAVAAGRGPHLSPWSEESDRFRLDLPQLVRNQLYSAGIGESRIEDCTVCTVCHPELFFSHRRDGDPRRMLSVVGWKEEP